jgi:hypothetical protein
LGCDVPYVVRVLPRFKSQHGYESTLRPATDELMEYICQENNQYGFASGAR